VDLTIDPPSPAWRELLDRSRGGIARQELLGRTVEQWRVRTRRELNLDERGPLIGTGHQANYWHPGILAKPMAVAAAAAEFGAGTISLIVDQDEPEFATVEYPQRDENGRLDIGVWRVTEARAGVVVARHPPFDPGSLPEPPRAALPCVLTGLQVIRDGLRRHRDSPSAGAQVGSMLHELMRPWTGAVPMRMASQLMTTELASTLVRAMISEPVRCVEAHNAAARAAPDAGITPLQLGGDSVELPLWRIGDDGRRVRASARDAAAWLDDPARGPTLLPRALMMTMLVRLGLCDLFVHGLGGATYDGVMEHWCRAWLKVDPAPKAVVSATLRLPLRGERADDPGLAPALRNYRVGWHDPLSLRNHQRPSAAKHAILQRIDLLPRRSAERRRAYGELHDQLARERMNHGPELASLLGAIELARQREHERPIVERRTWAFPLYPEKMIDELAAAVAQSYRPVRATVS
jgi:hypothetical protein